MSQLEQEIREQSSVLAGRAEAGWGSASEAARLLRREDVDHLVIAARGTSDNAARYAQYLLGLEARLPVGLAAPWLYGGPQPPRLSRAAVLAISQSGRSPDIRTVLATAQAQGRPTIAITNDASSPMVDAADVVVPMLAGAEQSVAATKTYLASLHAVAQISACLAPRGRADRDQWWERLPHLVSAAVDEQLSRRARFDPLNGVQLITAVGRGLQLSTVHETALKIRELSGIPAEAFSVPDLVHGPIAGVRTTGALWVVSTKAREQPDVATLRGLRQGAGLTVAVADVPELVDAADIGVTVPAGLPEWIAPMVAVIAGQAAALRLGELSGGDVDHPHGLHKVTLTR
jgi:glucosamine--fructose-6-phosphate aminotransferase (isomerizing)